MRRPYYVYSTEICYNRLVGKDEIEDINKWTTPADDQIDFSHFPAETQAHKDKAVIGIFTHGAYL